MWRPFWTDCPPAGLATTLTREFVGVFVWSRPVVLGWYRRRSGCTQAEIVPRASRLLDECLVPSLTLWLPVTYEADARDWTLSTLLMSALLMEPVCIWVPVAPGASIAVLPFSKTVGIDG